MHFKTSSDPYTVTEQFKKKVLWGGGRGKRLEGGEIYQYHLFIFSNEVLLIFTQSFCFD